MALRLTGWIDTQEQARTPECLTETEVERLYRACTKSEPRLLVAVLFDSGARAEELHNLCLVAIQTMRESLDAVSKLLSQNPKFEGVGVVLRKQQARLW